MHVLFLLPFLGSKYLFKTFAFSLLTSFPLRVADSEVDREVQELEEDLEGALFDVNRELTRKPCDKILEETRLLHLSAVKLGVSATWHEQGC